MNFRIVSYLVKQCNKHYYLIQLKKYSLSNLLLFFYYKLSPKHKPEFFYLTLHSRQSGVCRACTITPGRTQRCTAASYAATLVANHRTLSFSDVIQIATQHWQFVITGKLVLGRVRAVYLGRPPLRVKWYSPVSRSECC